MSIVMVLLLQLLIWCCHNFVVVQLMLIVYGRALADGTAPAKGSSAWLLAPSNVKRAFITCSAARRFMNLQILKKIFVGKYIGVIIIKVPSLDYLLLGCYVWICRYCHR